jgi:hypothetical protein
MTKTKSTYLALLAVLLSPMAANAGLIQIGIGGFSGGETVETYGLDQTFVPVDGVTFSGVLHNFTVLALPSLDAVIDSGPGNTNNITVANIEGDATGILSLLFPGLQSRVGFGFALSAGGSAVIELFDVSNISLGSITLLGVPDPSFAGGFLGVESSTLFSRAEVSFLSPGRFAFDNLRFENVPEPGTLALLGIGLFGMGLARRRRKV